ncbi:MAG TPA: NfeD family protein [Bacilli bacterium]|nr:NfeD family protein [Bacilli bacterium]
MVLTSFFQDPSVGIYFWAGVFILALIIELMEPQLVSIWFCGGALISFVLALLGVPLLIQAGVFIVVSAVLLILSFKFFRKSILDRPKVPTNADSMIDQEILLLSDVDKTTLGDGLYKDIQWKVIVDEDISFQKDEIAVIKQIKGNRLVIKKKEGK